MMNISAKRLQEINNIPDESIDTSDIPELDNHFWENAKLIRPIPKKAISIRIDSDVLDWFKNQGKGYTASRKSKVKSQKSKVELARVSAKTSVVVI